MTVQITALYGSLLGLWLIVLSARVILARRESSISLGHKDNKTLERRIRAQGNFAEYTPMALLLLALMELQGGPAWALHVPALVLLAGRLMHGYALSFTGHSPLRVPGIALTLASIILLSLGNLSLLLA